MAEFLPEVENYNNDPSISDSRHNVSIIAFIKTNGHVEYKQSIFSGL
jgi:hypothetical protein